ncbi:MAG TPA: mechanosensitive ion channel [candidate division Zixibacteria bacterium]|nr:mechanosensitive ion channel [candidate division Zixibacteria bacterium]
MEYIQTILKDALSLIPSGIALLVLLVALWIVRLIIDRSAASKSGSRLRRQVITGLLSFAGLLVIIMVSPLNDNQKGQLLSLIGILLSAAIALSATTFVGNIMAGLMLRAVRNFRPGDFIQVNEHFGRVTERGLFHIEIQTESRDLTTLPNLYLVSNPVKVIRASGTVVSADVSLGYDLAHQEVERCLLKAAEEAGLHEPFVYITDLGDYSVTYRASGLLVEVKQLLSSRSALRQKIMDHLHGAGIEIVSPTFMNQRPLPPDKKFIPTPHRTATRSVPPETSAPEAIVFDKADEAESVEKLRERLEETIKSIDAVNDEIKEADNETDRKSLTDKRDRLEAHREWYKKLLDHKENPDKPLD